MHIMQRTKFCEVYGTYPGTWANWVLGTDITNYAESLCFTLTNILSLQRLNAQVCNQHVAPSSNLYYVQ